MHRAVSDPEFVKSSLGAIAKHLNDGDAETRAAVAEAIGSTDPNGVEAARAKMAAHFSSTHETALAEPSHGDVDYVSRFDIVGIYQSALSRVFSRIPNLQGYGDANPVWLTTLVEEGAYKIGSFFKGIFADVHGQHEPLLQSILKEWKALESVRAPYPSGVPVTIRLAPKARVALLADWGGDNPAARHIASVATKQKPDLVIHLGDIYYGGVKSECETFLRLWPFQTNMNHPELGVRPGSSYALNGNHEMYSGGQSYFDIVLKAFGQPQPFFCLENDHWRLIGLDTAYNGGRLKPTGQNDPFAAQWGWLVGLLSKTDGKKNILLTHHQPVSAHAAEFKDSQGLRDDIQELLHTTGVNADAIFGWFFGHEHRCAIYKDSETEFNARLIGNGCIPHEVQNEDAADAGCTTLGFVNRRQTDPDSGAATSMFALLSFAETGPELLIEYLDEDFVRWGAEVWNADKGRQNGEPFSESDFDDKLKKFDRNPSAMLKKPQ